MMVDMEEKQRACLEHDEGRIKDLHCWIEKVCDPSNNFCQDLNNTLLQRLKSSFKSDLSETQLHRKVGSFALKTFPFEDLVQHSKDEELEGLVNIKHQDGTIIEGNYTQGLPHGFFRHLNAFGDLEFFGCFSYGTLISVCWKSLPGGSFLISRDLYFTDSDMIYLYPDCRTGLVGSFKDCHLKAAKLSEVMNYEKSYGSVPIPIMSEPNGVIYTFDPASPSVFCPTPDLPDPYEALFVEVKQSQISNAGEGLFAKVDIDVGTIISFYNGVTVSSVHDLEKETPYKMVLDEGSDLDLPESMTSLENYRATLGHKVCHSFIPNADADIFCHPRFGMIRCIATIENIAAGEEIFINYGYSMSEAPTWYKLDWARHQKRLRNIQDWKTAVWWIKGPVSEIRFKDDFKLA